MNHGQFNALINQLERLNANLERQNEIADESRRTLNRVDERLRGVIDILSPNVKQMKAEPSRKTVTGSKKA